MLLPSLLVGCLLNLALASDVLDLKTASFDDELSKHPLILVEFFAPWCGHCKQLAPEYEIAATKLKANDPPVPLAKVDCVDEESQDICSRYDVSGYPTLKIFKGFVKGDASTDKPEEYNGPRDASGIVKYMKGRSGPASREIKTVGDLEKLKKSDNFVVVGFFSDPQSTFAKEFSSAADALRENFDLAHSSNEKVLKSAGVNTDEVIIYRPTRYHTKLEDSMAKLGNADAKRGDIEGFVKKRFAGAAGHITGDNQGYFPHPLCVVYYQVDYVKNAKGTNYWRNRVLQVAKDFQDKISFAVAAKSDFAEVLEDIQIDTGSEDVNVVVWDAMGQKFRMDPATAFSKDALKKFVDSYLNGELEPHVKSEDVPEDNSGPVKVVVGKNFNAIVNDPERDVLIEFYAPWCGHCKSLEPKYNELGDKFEDEDSIVIAKMDATANDVPPAYDVKGFPTIYWAPKGNKSNPRPYEGGREVKDFVAFIEKEASTKNLNIAGKDEL